MKVLKSYILSGVLLLAACAHAPEVAPLKVGQQLDFAALQNQFGQAFNHQADMRYLLYTNSMAASRQVRDALHSIDTSCYEQGGLVFVADISGMPSLITKLIAVPKMRGYPFPVWLDYDGEASEALPVQEDMISVIQVDQGAITNIEFVQDQEALLTVLVPVCGYAQQQVAILHKEGNR